MILREDLPTAQIVGWIKRQRWYSGGSDDPTSCTLETASIGEQAALPGHRSTLVSVLAHLDFAVGPRHSYFIPLLLGADGWQDAVADPHAAAILIAMLEHPAANWAGEWLDAPRSGEGPIRPLSVDQSNSSLYVDQRYVVKIVRRPLVGDNPEIAIGRALRRARSSRAATYAGALTMGSNDGPRDVLIAHRHVPGRLGFDLARHDAAAAAAGRVPMHFPGAAHDLGFALGTLHAELAAHFDVVDVPASDLTATLQRRLDALESIAALTAFRTRARDRYDAFARARTSVATQRIHSDLHLGQVILSPDGWVFIDFEGEPRRGLAERGARSTALRDVAGIVRSFEYAAFWDGIDGVADQWQGRNRELFLQGYRENRADEIDEDLLEILLIDKALYEVGYETTYRPERVEIPLAALRRALG